ncbi:MAG TPA: response regulator [Mucilaginibacter sp.]|jgi:DNA-binding response OmpR family regulator|nr:response regulator [Mucilaginibacter sp.]
MQRILVVDDNEDILEVIKLILEDYNYDVVTLSDGSLLLDKVTDSHPDLILLDVMLGKVDGRDLCKTIKSTPETKEIPVILISASHQVQERNTLNGVAPDDFLAKPFDIDDLLEKVQAHTVAA